MNSIFSSTIAKIRRTLHATHTDADHFGDLLTYSMTRRESTPTRDGE